MKDQQEAALTEKPVLALNLSQKTILDTLYPVGRGQRQDKLVSE